MDIAAVLIRAIVLVVVIPLVGWVVGATTGGHDANIGAGLLAFAAAIAVSGIWGFLDGRQAGSLGGMLLRWALVAVLAVLGLIAYSVIRNAGGGVPTASSIDLAFFFLGLIAVPAFIGVAIGHATQRGGA